MIKICPECLNISVDTEDCKFCGFPFSKKIVGRLDDYYFYDIVELVNSGQIEEAKQNLIEKKVHLSDHKHLLLSEKTGIVVELTTRADKYAQQAIAALQSYKLDSAIEQITSALAIYKHPRFIEIEVLINKARKKEEILQNASSKYQQALAALKKEETAHGLQLLKEAIALNPSDKEIKNKFEEEEQRYQIKTIETIKAFVSQKDYAAAELLLTEAEPFCFSNETYKALQNQVASIKKKRRIIKIMLIIFVVFAVLTGSLLCILKYINTKSNEEKWKAIIDEENIQTYQRYITEHKNSPYLQEANRNLQTLLTKDSTLWNRAQATQIQYDYKNYVEMMERSGGMHVEDAKTKIDSLDWVAIPKDADIAAFENYLQTHPNGRFASLARNKISLEPTETEKIELLQYISSYFNAYQNKDLETVMMFYSPITESFGSRRNLTKADLRLILENDLKTISNSSSKIDPSSFKIKKNEKGEAAVTFNADSYVTRVLMKKNEQFESESREDEVMDVIITYYTNAQWFLTLDADRKIISYKFKIISEQQIN